MNIWPTIPGHDYDLYLGIRGLFVCEAYLQKPLESAKTLTRKLYLPSGMNAEGRFTDGKDTDISFGETELAIL